LRFEALEVLLGNEEYVENQVKLDPQDHPEFQGLPVRMEVSGLRDRWDPPVFQEFLCVERWGK
jgi:hypothetical protein